MPAVKYSHLWQYSFEAAYLALHTFHRSPLSHNVLILFHYTLYILGKHMHEMFMSLLLVDDIFSNSFFNCIYENIHTGLKTYQVIVVDFFEDSKVLLINCCPLWVER